MFYTSSRLSFQYLYFVLLCLNESVAEAVNNMNIVSSFLIEVFSPMHCIRLMKYMMCKTIE